LAHRRISEDQIQQGLEWVLAHMEEHQIRVINISAGGDFEESILLIHYRRPLNVVRAPAYRCCAVGNAGHARVIVLPPAALLHLSLSEVSTIGITGPGAPRHCIAHLMVPLVTGCKNTEVNAPGIWVAAPHLPHTPTAEEAELYSKLTRLLMTDLRAIHESNAGVDKDLDEASALPIPLMRQLITVKLREGKRDLSTTICRWHFVRAPIVS